MPETTPASDADHPPTDPPPPTGTTNDPNLALTMMLQMQQQQMAMQQQINQLLSHLTPDTTNPTPPPPQQQHVQRSKPIRPTVDADFTDNKWVVFKDAWARYKQMARLTNPDEIRNELRSACTAAVNELLFNFVGPEQLNRATEDELLTHMKSVAVKKVHPEVYRQQFFRLRQSEGESITHFVSRLKSQAMLCDFVQKCDDGQCETSYSANMITSQLIAGLYNQLHQSKVLSEVGSLKTLSQLVERLLTLESTAQAASHFQPASPVVPSALAPVKSEYQRNKQSTPAPRRPADATESAKCNGCGKKRHEQGRKVCPANGRTCNTCGKMNHFASACRSRSSTNSILSDNNDGDISFLSTVNEEPVL